MLAASDDTRGSIHCHDVVAAPRGSHDPTMLAYVCASLVALNISFRIIRQIH